MTPYYEDEKAGIVIYHGDCREILPSLGGFASVVTDPPYGTELLGGGYGRRQLVSADGRSGHTIANDHDLSALASALPSIVAALRPAGWFSTFAAARRRWECESLLVAAGLTLVGEMVWDKGVPGLGYTIRYAHETAVIARKGEGKSPETALLSVVRAPQEVRAMAGRHPHEKPVEVMARLVGFSSSVGDDILDPFMGRGTTLRAAKDAGRRATGIDIAECWCEAAAQLLSQEVLNFGGAA